MSGPAGRVLLLVCIVVTAVLVAGPLRPVIGASLPFAAEEEEAPPPPPSAPAPIEKVTPARTMASVESADTVASADSESSGSVASTEAAPPSSAPDREERTTQVARAARPVRVQIPSIGVDAELIGVGLNGDGSMQVPDFGLAGWYNVGPRPGEPGPAVIVAHVDSYEGPDVFFRLRELTRGDEIRVRHRDGTSSRFVVRSSEQQLKEELPVDRIWNDTRQPVLRLVTCGGDFDYEERHYRSNVIVYAARQPA
ncbi:MAG TPA: class F sortase [Euzebyales bacterium]